jgi:predicted nucleotidyltransferase
MLKDRENRVICREKFDYMIQIQPLLNRYFEILKEDFKERLLCVAIFGSIARGTAQFPESDIDVLIVMEGVENLSFGQRIKLTMNIEEKLSGTQEYSTFKNTYGVRPNFQEIIFAPMELKGHPPVLLDLTTDSMILYDTGILREEIAKIKKRLNELGSKKIKLKNSWFWILKPDVKPGENVVI